MPKLLDWTGKYTKPAASNMVQPCYCRFIRRIAPAEVASETNVAAAAAP